MLKSFWILKKVNSSSYKKEGPYTIDKIKNFLIRGYCSDKDFAWQPGFEEWKRLSLIKNLSTHPGHTMEDTLIQQARKYQTQTPKNIEYLSSYNEDFDLFKVTNNFF